MNRNKNASSELYFYNIDFLRFLLILPIIACHLNQGITNLHPEIYGDFLKYTNWSWLAADCFFVISGFFLFYKTNFTKNFWTFAIKKLMRYMPTILIVLFIIYLVSLFTPIKWLGVENIFTVFNLQNVGFTLRNGNIPPSWFVSALFWVSCFYFYLYKIVKKEIFNIITFCLVFVSYSMFLHVPDTWNIINYNYFVNIGVVRAIAGVGAGYFIYLFYLQYNDTSIKLSSTAKFVVSLIEVYSLSFIAYNLCFCIKPYNNYLVVILMFVLLFTLFLIREGLISTIFDQKIFKVLGKYIYSIFITHYLIKDLWEIYIANSQFAIYHPIVNILFVYIISILVGIVTYYIIEKPLYKYFMKKFKQ